MSLFTCKEKKERYFDLFCNHCISAKKVLRYSETCPFAWNSLSYHCALFESKHIHAFHFVRRKKRSIISIDRIVFVVPIHIYLLDSTKDYIEVRRCYQVLKKYYGYYLYYVLARLIPTMTIFTIQTFYMLRSKVVIGRTH